MRISYQLRRKCPHCRSREVYESRRSGVWEMLLIHPFLLRPFRCYSCRRRYWGFLLSVTAPQARRLEDDIVGITGKVTLTVLLALCLSAGAWADTIHTSGQWNAGKTANNNTAGPNAFWDNVSSDGPHCNVGFLLDGGMGNCQNINVLGTLPNKPLEYLSANGNSDAAASFYVTPGSGDQGVYQASIAGFSGDNNQFHDVFGWALLGCSTASCLHPLFNDSNDNPNQTALFSPGGDFRYYIAVYNVLNQLQWIHFSDTNGNFFALFSQDPPNPSGPPSYLSTYWIGSEDAHTTGDFDFQDILVEITPIPEPGTLLLLGSGAFCLVTRRCRK